MKKSTRPSAAVFAVTLLLGFLSFVHRPLPVGFTDCLSDRFAMHLIEPALRLTYYWPANYLCSNARCRLTWTRSVLDTLSRVIDPRNLLDYDSELQISTEDFAGVKVRLYLPKGNRSSDGAVYFVHGGGFVMGNTEIYEGLMRRMGKMLRMPIVSVDYRLAPETQYPGGLHDVERALIHFFERSREFDVDPTKIVAMGDSAGGNLVAAVAQRLRKNKEFRLAGQVLLYPLLQFHNLQSDSFRHFHRDMVGYALVDPVSLAYYYMWYAGIDVNHRPALAEAAVSNGHVSARVRNLTGAYTDLHNLPTRLRHKNLPTVAAVVENEEAQMLMEERLLDPSFSPLIQHDLTGLPPSFVMTCQYDILRDEGVLYAKRMYEAGTVVEWKHYDNGFHAMLNFHNELYIAQEALRDIATWVERIAS